MIALVNLFTINFSLAHPFMSRPVFLCVFVLHQLLYLSYSRCKANLLQVELKLSLFYQSRWLHPTVT